MPGVDGRALFFCRWLDDFVASHGGMRPAIGDAFDAAFRIAWKECRAALASAPAGAGEGASRKVLATALRELREAGRMVDVAPNGNAEVRRWFCAVENADAALAGEPAVAADEGRELLMNLTDAQIDALWKAYQLGQVSADHTAKEVFTEVLRVNLAALLGKEKP